MTRQEANSLLDELKDGATYPSRLVDAALWLTGDLNAYEALRSTGMDSPIQEKSGRGWRTGSKLLVAQNHSRY